MSRVLLIDDDADLRDALAQTLELEGFAVMARADGAAGLAALEGAASRGRAAIDCVVCDIRMPGPDGMAVLERARALDADLPVILVTGHGDVPLAVEAMRAGAYDFIEKPLSTARLVATLTRALEHRRLLAENRRLRDDVPVPLVGLSAVTRDLARTFATLREARAGALIVGPDGAGQNQLAEELARPFRDEKRPVRRVNCANLASSLAADLAGEEVFGAHGVWERAAGGLLALENASALPGAVQATLAERCETGEGHADAPALVLTTPNARALDASLLESFAARRLDLVPLARRREDVVPLFAALAARAAARFRRPVPDLPAGFAGWAGRAELAGDVAELQAQAERFVLGLWSPARDGAGEGGARLAERVGAHEKLVIESELARHGGRIRPTYEALGLSRKGLYDKMRRHGIRTQRGSSSDRSPEGPSDRSPDRSPGDPHDG